MSRLLASAAPRSDWRARWRRSAELARKLAASCADGTELARALQRYRASIAALDRAMDRHGVVAACSSCAGAVQGGCCFVGMEDGFDEVQFALNRLLGAPDEVPARAHRSCAFVGSRGCVLPGKQSFCLNYFCEALARELGPERLDTLRRLTGEQLWAAHELERIAQRVAHGALSRPRPEET